MTTGIGKKDGCLLSYSQAEPGRELTQPSPHLLAEPCIHPPPGDIIFGLALHGNLKHIQLFLLNQMLAKNGLHLMKFVDPNFRASPRKGKAKREGVTLGVPLSPSVDTLGNFTTELVSCVLCDLCRDRLNSVHQV